MSLNNIYSRPRIRLKQKSKKQKIKFTLLLLLLIILILIIIILKIIYPTFVLTCEATANSNAVTIVNSQVKDVMESYCYEDLVNIVRTDENTVSYIEAKIVPINQLVNEIINNIQNELDELTTITVSLNLGSITGIGYLTAISPKVKVKMESYGKIETSIKSEFVSVGINQTLHEIYLNLKCKVGILTPFGTVSDTVESEVLLAETVIIGDIPETYYNFENLGFEDLLNMVN